MVEETEPRFSETMWFKLGAADDSAAVPAPPADEAEEAELEERYVDSGLLSIEDKRAYSLGHASPPPLPPPRRKLTAEETEFLDRYSDADLDRYMIHERVPGRRRIGLVVGIGVVAMSFAASALPWGDVVENVEQTARADREQQLARPAASVARPVASVVPTRVAAVASSRELALAPVPETVAPRAETVAPRAETVVQVRSSHSAKRATPAKRSRHYEKDKRAEGAKARRAKDKRAAKRAKDKRAAKRAKAAKAKRAKAAKAKRAKAAKTRRSKDRRTRRQRSRG